MDKKKKNLQVKMFQHSSKICFKEDFDVRQWEEPFLPLLLIMDSYFVQKQCFKLKQWNDEFISCKRFIKC